MKTGTANFTAGAREDATTMIFAFFGNPSTFPLAATTMGPTIPAMYLHPEKKTSLPHHQMLVESWPWLGSTNFEKKKWPVLRTVPYTPFKLW